MPAINEHEWLSEQFEVSRSHLRAVAYRMLGSFSEADDAVQEAWLRLSRTDVSAVENMGGWLTTVVARISLDMLRARTSRREEPLGEHVTGALASHAAGSDPEHAVVLADSVGFALLVVLDTLGPAERLAFVLHDIFGVPFDAIAPIVERSPAAARKLASRARQRVRGATTTGTVDSVRQREIVTAFVAASREGNFNALLAVLAPDVVLRADRTAVAMGGTAEIRGATAVAKQFSGRARAAQPALVNGVPGVAVVPKGRLLLVLTFTMKRGKIVAIDAVADPTQLSELSVVLDAPTR